MMQNQRLEALRKNREEKEEQDDIHLSDAKMKRMMPIFVEIGRYPDGDHKCGICSMRTPSDECTVTDIRITRDKGTCTFWAGGESAKNDDIHAQRMTTSVAGYVLSDKKVKCKTCVNFDDGYCLLWEGAAGEKECCISWSSGEEESVAPRQKKRDA